MKRKPKRKEIDAQIRWMIRRDMPEVIAIEDASFDSAWSEGDFTDVMTQRNVIGMVAEFDRQVMGYMVYELQHKRLEILNFAVSPDHRRRKVGWQMIERMKDKLSQDRRSRIGTVVSEQSTDAHLFFRHCGFRCTQVMRRWYEDCDDDAYRFLYELPTDDIQDRIASLMGNQVTIT